MNIEIQKMSSLEDRINSDIKVSNEIILIWLGQAGFFFNFDNLRILIDPYLSDFLSRKYKDSIFPHVRLMKTPIIPEKITNVDFVLSTHSHSDHMDPETLPILSNLNHNCSFIIPKATIEEALKRGIPESKMIAINANESINLPKCISILAIPASHETLKVNESGEHFFLGYILDFNGFKVYHSGDCTPYDGLIEKLREIKIDLALLPINGRDDYRFKHGIAGNFTINEVIDICQSANIKILIPHHFGMFAYNTVSEKQLNALRGRSSDLLTILIPEIGKFYKLSM
jgi:L-ascorbate metabolism protein UlaG (beta-lactamase superfamily)